MAAFMIELFVRGAALCVLTAIALVLFRRTAAAYRHLMCILALCGLLVLPLAQRVMPPLPLLSAPAPVMVQVDRRPEGSAAAPPMLPERGQQDLTVTPAALPPDTTPIAPAPRSHTLNATTAIFVIWGIGAAILLIRLTVALFRLRRMEAESWEAILAGVPIRVSDRVDTPLTWGIRRSVILMPVALLSDDHTVCESAIRHEQAHIVRRDWIWNLLAEMVCAFCWFQPGAWWLRRRMRLESERACDDMVLLSGVAGTDYAAHLLQILRTVRTNQIAPAMAQCGGTEERMRHILDTKKPRRAGRIGLALAAQFGIALLLLTALRVSARSAEAKPLAENSPVGMQSDGPDLPAAQTAAPTMTGLPFQELPPMAVNRDRPDIPAPMASALPGPESPQGNPPAAIAVPEPVTPVKSIIWGKAVDGLQPGYSMTTPAPPNTRVPFNTRVAYQVFVRNTSRQERAIEIRCQNTDADRPYLIPGDDISGALRARPISEDFRSMGVTELSEITAAYAMRLAPGETVVVPGEMGLYIGDADQLSYPRTRTVKPGTNWLLQPISIHMLNAQDQAYADTILKSPYTPKKFAITLDRAGKTGRIPMEIVGAHTPDMQLFAQIRLQVGAPVPEPGR